jgi:hypothetical protein
MDALIFLGRTLGFSFAAGINLYATVALLGLASRYGWVALPPEYQVFDNSWIIGTALFLYAIEFFADKVPWIDSAWDTLHTFIRPLGGALIALTALGDASPAMETMSPCSAAPSRRARISPKPVRVWSQTPARSHSRTGS